APLHGAHRALRPPARDDALRAGALRAGRHPWANIAGGRDGDVRGAATAPTAGSGRPTASAEDEASAPRRIDPGARPQEGGGCPAPSERHATPRGGEDP